MMVVNDVSLRLAFLYMFIQRNRECLFSYVIVVIYIFLIFFFPETMSFILSLTFLSSLHIFLLNLKLVTKIIYDLFPDMINIKKGINYTPTHVSYIFLGRTGRDKVGKWNT